jgi:YEATS domain-containing protein 4
MSVLFCIKMQATETATHRWIVFLRSPFGIDLSHVIEKVTFELHSSFPDPIRDVTQQPFELTEAGWGEFDIVVRLHFLKDTQEPPFELYHHLQLGLDAHGNPQKRPHLHEVFEEIVFWEPTEDFYKRVASLQPEAAPVSQLAQYFGKYDPSIDYNRIQNARKRLAPATAHLKAQLAALEAEENGLAPMETG